MKLFDLFRRKKKKRKEMVKTCKDSMLLQAAPVTRKQMDLLWLHPRSLSRMMEWVSQHGVAVITIGDGFIMRKHEITYDDLLWAKQIEPIVDKASVAYQSGDYKQTIAYYKKALELAPGCDMYLMNIGNIYARLRKKKKAVKYLERAAYISPDSFRIRDELREARKIGKKIDQLEVLLESTSIKRPKIYKIDKQYEDLYKEILSKTKFKN
ncbi:MAG: tetratricopeptide repeat protein [Tannerella sp.]|nr:tetratricopeptide repeat protein [Tannerella sp.]